MRVALAVCLAVATVVATGASATASTLLIPENYTLAAALAAAQPGDTLSVADLTLDGGEVVVSKPITLLSRTLHGNRVERLWLDAAADSVQVVGFHVGYHNPYEGEAYTTHAQGVVIGCTRARLVDCLIQGLVPWFEFSEPPQFGFPVAIAASSHASFLRCTFRGNATGGNMHGEVIAANCIHQGAGLGKTCAPMRLEACSFVQQSGAIVAAGPLQVVDSTFRACGGYLVTADEGLLMTGNVISNFTLTESSDCAFGECYGYTAMVRAWGSVQIDHNTFVDTKYVSALCACPTPTPAEVPALIVLDATATGSIANNLFIGQPGAAVDAPAGVLVACNDAFQSADVHWRGGIGDVTGTAGNFSAGPLFCGRAQGDYTISIYSRAAPEHSGGCGLIGALGTGCETEVATLVKAFTARRDAARTGNAVELRWELSRPLGVVIRRFEAGNMIDVHQTEAFAALPTDRFIDQAAPTGELRYALGVVDDGLELFPIAWVTIDAAAAPTRSQIAAVSPNPFNPSTVVRFVIAPSSTARAAGSGASGAGGNPATPAAAPGARAVLLTIHDLAGREVVRLLESSLQPGPHEVAWNGLDRGGRAVASGVYLAVLSIDGVRQHTQKLALVR